MDSRYPDDPYDRFWEPYARKRCATDQYEECYATDHQFCWHHRLCLEVAPYRSDKAKLAPAPGSQLSPLLNAGEVLEWLEIKRKTHTRDAISLEKIKSSLCGYPSDWSGNPCMPDKNLTIMGISGSLSPNFANLTALTGILLDDNKLSGHVPDLSSLRNLELLYLQNNDFTGEVSKSLDLWESIIVSTICVMTTEGAPTADGLYLIGQLFYKDLSESILAR
ncbi:hypothetical protein MLD38_039631 [Melastoma candidum]|uniref:Uncharacterized protein n=1 Tax=Melastoma candidum TaxID=119954 RepID=A0ACB9L2Q9_9MYRT|nr:hypothetical protein MLD38_039631 [Melastoma candidum]